MANTSYVYCDFDSAFIPNPITGDISVFYDSDVIQQSVENLILTNFYERQFQPTVGSGIPGSMFENMSPATQTALQNNITNCIQNYEPRANLIAVNVNVDIDNNAVSISITFNCSTNPTPQTLTVLLDRVR